MIEVAGEVTRIEGEFVRVRVAPRQGCGRCHEAGGCRSDLLAQLFGAQEFEFPLHNTIGAQPGQRVIVRVPTSAPREAAVRAYLLPAMGLVAGAVAGALYSSSDLYVAIGAMCGFAVAIVVARRLWPQHLSAPQLAVFQVASHTPAIAVCNRRDC